MNYFKDKNTGEVHAYDQEQIDGGWVKEGLVAMTDVWLELRQGRKNVISK